MNRLLLIAAAGALAAVVAVGVATGVTPRHGSGPVELGQGPLAIVESSGGLCLDPRSGGGVPCGSRTVITSRTVTVTGGGTSESRPLTAAERLRLVAAIRSFDPDGLRPFTSICPTAYDGTKSVYTFRGVGGSFDSCEWDLAAVRAAVVASAIASRP